jgi:purine-nucleoside phosphorylase
VDPSTTDPFGLAADAAAELARRTGREHHDVLIVLGSGWQQAAEVLGEGIEVAMSELPGFATPSAGGHGASIRSLRIGGRNVLCAFGRLHLYEGHGPGRVVHGVRTAAAAGCTTLLLTNAAGSLRTDWTVGQVALIRDHINLTGQSPLVGPHPPERYGSRFVDMSAPYDPALRALAKRVDPTLDDGVYAGFLGPQFETAAEVRMAGILGADLVGMSSVMETIAAAHLGMRVLALSLATNLAAGLSGHPLSGEEVFAAARAATPRLAGILGRVTEAVAETA